MAPQTVMAKLEPPPPGSRRPQEREEEEKKRSGIALFLMRLVKFTNGDATYLAAGLAMLFIAPMIVSLLTSENAPASEQSFFGSGTSPYERGLTGLAPGEPSRGTRDRLDPSNIMLVDGKRHPPAGSGLDYFMLATGAEGAVAAAASAAVEATALPAPKDKTSAAMRGLKKRASADSTAMSKPTFTAFNDKKLTTSLTGTVGSGYSGTAASASYGSWGSLEQLKRNAAGQESDFNRGGNARDFLQAAARRSMGSGRDGSRGAISAESLKAGASGQGDLMNQGRTTGAAVSGDVEHKWGGPKESSPGTGLAQALLSEAKTPVNAPDVKNNTFNREPEKPKKEDQKPTPPMPSAGGGGGDQKKDEKKDGEQNPQNQQQRGNNNALARNCERLLALNTSAPPGGTAALQGRTRAGRSYCAAGRELAYAKMIAEGKVTREQYDRCMRICPGAN